MGALSGLGQGIAEAQGGGTDALSLAKSSLGYGAATTALNTAGALAGGIGGFQQASYAAKVARMSGDQALLAGQLEESASKAQFGELAARQKAQAAAQGVGVTGENVRAVLGNTAATSALDAAILHFNAAKQAFGDYATERVDKAAASNSLSSGLFKAGSSFLTGASGLSAKWAAYKQAGVFAPPTPSSSAFSWNFPGD